MKNLRPVSDELFEYLVGRANGSQFESFAKRVFAAHFGEAFTPLGGIHDGGADGSISSFVQEVQGKPNTFVQFSVTEDRRAESKIKETIDSLRRAGRDPRQVIYATNKALPKADLIAQEIWQDYSVMVQIRDVERLKGYINTDAGANDAFHQAFDADIRNLSRAANLQMPAVSEFARDPTVYVFLNHELRDRFTRDHLNNRVLDALIYWALRDTDPDKKLLMKREEIAASIESAFPPAKSILLGNLNDRLSELSKKDAATGLERLRHYRKTDDFCLPFETRRALASEASGAVLQQERFKASIAERLHREVGREMRPNEEEACVALVFSTIHRYFIDQGLLLAAFLEGRLENVQISDQVVEDTMVKALAETDDARGISPEQFGACLSVLRGIFYGTRDDERKYLAYLSRTSCLLVTLQSAPRLLEYLNQMGGNFRLLVGSDLIVKAISEEYLDRNNRQVANLLLVCRQLGSELVLTEPVLNEIFTHLHATDLEYRNHYWEREQYLKPDDISECDRILIRAYLHARRTHNGPDSWRRYVNALTDPDGLRAKAESARQALRGLLVQRFGMSYLPMEELESAVSRERVVELATRLDESRQVKHEELSYNDALMVYAVYAQRRQRGESGIYDGFGYRTWWLTKETRVLALTGALVQSEGGVPYIMRPEFMLNFVALAPKAAEVRKSFADLLPTTAGLQLGQHLNSEVMHDLLRDAAEWARLTPERVSVMLSERVNRLKHDRFKRYVHNISHS
ncbi:MAG: hypothetical protein BroJett031_15380 [Betaproteobacteria bacterium]|nr:MAG: hypothetical protein BroJett031_15380 [Betaproteobacteria bacterium]